MFRTLTGAPGVGTIMYVYFTPRTEIESAVPGFAGEMTRLGIFISFNRLDAGEEAP